LAKLLQGERRWGTRRQAMVEIEAARPGVRLEHRHQDQTGQSRQREDDEQVPSSVAERAGEMCTGVGANDLERMQPRVAHLDK
jgi:hypothetical protein